MKRKIRKVTAAVAAVTLAVSGISAQNMLVGNKTIVLAATKDGDTFTQGGLVYEVIQGNTQLKVSALEEGFSAQEVTIPSVINYEGWDFPVTEIADKLFSGNTTLTTVKFESGSKIVSIGEETFRNCTGLASVELPEGLTTLGSLAFENCTALESITLPSTLDTVTSKKSPFTGCTNLKQIAFAEGTTEIANNLFYECDFLTGAEFTIPDTVKSIDNYAFYKATNLAMDLNFSKNLETIGEGAFAECTALKKITFSEGLVSLGKQAFSGVSGVSELKLPESLKELNILAFANCTGLTEITIPKNVDTTNALDYSSFAANKRSPFYGCTNLKKVTFEEGMESIPGFILYEAESVEEVSIPASVTEIEQGAFFACTGITEVTLPSGLEIIGENAFNGATALKSITLPESLKELNLQAFANCTRLLEITIPKNVTTTNALDYSSFAVNKRSPIYGCTNLKKVTFEEGMTKIPAFILYEAENVEEVSIPASVTEIEQSAFWACTRIEEIALPEKLEIIGENAFNGATGLKSITLPESLKELNVQAFANCTRLTEITIPKNVTTTNALGYSSFAQNKRSPIYGCTNLTKVTFAEGMTKIPAYMMYEADSIKEVVIPGSVTEIGENAFYNCIDFSIYGLTGSYAETYANEYQIPFVSQGVYVAPTGTPEPSVTPTVAPTGTPTVAPTASTATPVPATGGAVTTTPTTSPDGVTPTPTVKPVTVSKVEISAAKRTAKKKAVVKWKKVAGASGYQITYATTRSFKKATTKTISAKKVSYTLTKLKKNTKYYVKVRAYKKNGNEKVYGSYSSVKVIAKK